jgi:hypothetical protein
MEVDAQQATSNVISEIREALSGHKELSRVVNYLNLGEKEFLKTLTGSTSLRLDNRVFLNILIYLKL